MHLPARSALPWLPSDPDDSPRFSREVGISESTVGPVSERIYRKLGAHNRSELSARVRVA